MNLFETIATVLLFLGGDKNKQPGGGPSAPPGGTTTTTPGPNWPRPPYTPPAGRPPANVPPPPANVPPPPANVPPPPAALPPVRVYRIADGDNASRVADRFSGIGSKRGDRWTWKELADAPIVPGCVQVNTSGSNPSPWVPGQCVALPDSWQADKGAEWGAKGDVSTAPRVSGEEEDVSGFDTV